MRTFLSAIAALLVLGLPLTVSSADSLTVLTLKKQSPPVVKIPSMCQRFPFCEGTTNEEKPPKEDT